MNEPMGFDRLVHSDWSKHAYKRWTVVALRTPFGWSVEQPEITKASAEFVDFLDDARFQTLAGFDFAIGLPSFYKRPTQQAFPVWLLNLSDAAFDQFADIANDPADISASRPFYPYNVRGKKRFHLLNAHGCSWNDLFRQCELRTPRRDPASPLFWTLGGKQVGRAAMAGWREILRPAISKGACMWPFDGSLRQFSSSPLTICETYPAEVYEHLRLGKFSKTSVSGRRSVGSNILDWAKKRKVVFAPEVIEQLSAGFDFPRNGDDPFDAVVGLCGMIEVVKGHRDESPSSNIDVQRREGWILGQTCLPLDESATTQ